MTTRNNHDAGRMRDFPGQTLRYFGVPILTIM
jgi:hypothetical protein